jgi:hypothetical protein
MKILALFSVLLVAWAAAQQYDDYGDGGGAYEPDNLYADYAAKQQQKAVGAGGGGLTKMVLGGAVGWFLGGKVHTRRLQKKLNAKHKEEQKALYQQYYNDVYTLQTQNAELIQALEQVGARMR